MSVKVNWFIYYIGLPLIFTYAVKDYITRNKKWCELSGVGFKRMLANEINLWKFCCEKEVK
jgi:hypothetical protein